MKFNFIFLLSLCLFMGACGDKDKTGTPKPKELVYSDSYIHNLVQTGTLVVVDEHSRPVAGASVLIGNEINHPFQNNLLKTDDKGMIIIPAEWTSALPVTIDLDGYIRVTYLEQIPGGIYFRIKKKNGFPQYEIYGETLGHNVKNYDDQLDFGLVVESMTKEDLLTFDINKVISPLSDVISVVGFDLSVPGNLSIPTQKESYFLPLTLSKPVYRIRTAALGKKRVLGLRGYFPFKTVVDAVRGGEKSYADMINYFNLFGGVLQEVNVTQTRTLANLNTKAMNFTAQTQIVAPFFKAQEAFLAIGASQNSGAWFPTDIKRLEPRQQQSLKLLPNGESYLIGVLKNKNEFAVGPNAGRMSATIVPVTPNAEFSLIPLIENPRMISNSEFTFTKPSQRARNIKESGTYAVISSTNTLRSEINETQVVLSREWEIYANSWIDSMKLPKFPSKPSRASRRLEVSFIGSTTARDIEPGSAMIENATHVTRSSIDF
ncbi:MAG: hypothetical protein AABY64_06085 [Bdellovibrionota bacterium]